MLVNDDADAGPVDGDAMTGFLWRHRVLVGVLAVLGAAAGVVGSRFMDRWYRADVLLSPAATESPASGGASALLGQFGSLASLAGINLGAQGNTSSLAVATLKSHAFLGNFIQQHALLPVLFAKQWDAGAGRWRAQPGERDPNVQDGVDYVLKHVLRVLEERDKNLFTIRVEWKDPALAAQWANLLVADLNEVMRQRAIKTADDNLGYLQREYERSQSFELRQSISANMQSQVTRRMLAVTRPEYSFTVVDPAVAPDIKDRVRPITVLNAAIGLFGGAAVAVFIALFTGRRRAS